MKFSKLNKKNRTVNAGKLKAANNSTSFTHKLRAVPPKEIEENRSSAYTYLAL